MDVIVLSYGTLLVTGGSIGYLKKGSTISLMAGLISGSAMIYSGSNINDRKLTATIVASLMTVVMGTRYWESKKFMPPGLIAVISFLIALKLISV